MRITKLIVTVIMEAKDMDSVEDKITVTMVVMHLVEVIMDKDMVLMGIIHRIITTIEAMDLITAPTIIDINTRDF